MESAKAIDAGAPLGPDPDARHGDDPAAVTTTGEDTGRGTLVHARLFVAIIAGIFAADQITKLVAVDVLSPAYFPRRVLGEVVRLTLVYNPGAAFGLHLGPQSRWIFMGLTVGALVLLGRLYQDTRQGDLRRVVSIALVCGGALGNLLDRIRSSRGVVDFIDVGVGSTRWPTFNVADMAVSCGALLLAYVLWREDVARMRASAAGDRHAPEVAGDLPRGSDGPDPHLHG